MIIIIQLQTHNIDIDMQQDITQKQSYLFHQIIQAGYSADIFQQFIQADSPSKGTNLSLWTMADLKALITKFKNIQNAHILAEQHKQQQQKEQQKQQQQRRQRYGKQQPLSPIIMKMNISASSNNNNNNNNSKNGQQFHKIIECTKAKQLARIQQNTQIIVDTYQKRQGGLFQKSYVVYQVKTKQFNSTVMRRYSDFQLLRELLLMIYQGMPLPQIPKKGKMKRKQQKHIIKRMYILEKFLNRIIMIPQIRHSQHFYKFLTAKDIRDLQLEKQKLKNLKSIPMSKIQTCTGQIQLKIDQSTNDFILKTQKYLTVAQPQMKTIYKQFKGVAQMFQKCAQKLTSVSQNCKALSKTYTQYQKQCDLPINKTNMYNLVAQMASRQAQFLNEEAKLFKKQFYSVIKYESFMMINYKQCIQKLISMQHTYEQHKINLQKKKQKLYQQNPSKWAIPTQSSIQKLDQKPDSKLNDKQKCLQQILPKQSKQLIDEQLVYALHSSQIYKQLQRYMRQNTKIVCTYLQQVLNMQSNYYTKGLMGSADLLILVKQMLVPVPVNVPVPVPVQQ